MIVSSCITSKEVVRGRLSKGHIVSDFTASHEPLLNKNPPYSDGYNGKKAGKFKFTNYRCLVIVMI